MLAHEWLRPWPCPSFRTRSVDPTRCTRWTEDKVVPRRCRSRSRSQGWCGFCGAGVARDLGGAWVGGRGAGDRGLELAGDGRTILWFLKTLGARTLRRKVGGLGQAEVRRRRVVVPSWTFSFIASPRRRTRAPRARSPLLRLLQFRVVLPPTACGAPQCPCHGRPVNHDAHSAGHVGARLGGVTHRVREGPLTFGGEEGTAPRLCSHRRSSHPHSLRKRRIVSLLMCSLQVVAASSVEVDPADVATALSVEALGTPADRLLPDPLFLLISVGKPQTCARLSENPANAAGCRQLNRRCFACRWPSPPRGWNSPACCRTASPTSRSCRSWRCFRRCRRWGARPCRTRSQWTPIRRP